MFRAPLNKSPQKTFSPKHSKTKISSKSQRRPSSHILILLKKPTANLARTPLRISNPRNNGTAFQRSRRSPLSWFFPQRLETRKYLNKRKTM